MIGSLFRFVSEWAGRDSQQQQQQQMRQQPPPFRPQTDLSEDAAVPEIATEMHHLVGPLAGGASDGTGGSGGVRAAETAIREWKSITNVDVFLEQVDFPLSPPLLILI